MAGNSVLTVSFANAANDNDTLRLEQKPWDDVGKTTAIDLIRAMASMFFNSAGSSPDCGYDPVDRTMTTEIYAYPSRPDLQYRIGSTMGSLSGGGLEIVPVIETINLKLQNSAETKHMVSSGFTAQWLGRVYNGEGDTVAPPSITADDTGYISLPEPVYGSMRVRYYALRYRHLLTVTPRENSPENSYQTVVWAAWDGGVEMLQVSPPPGAEEDLQNNTDCGNRGGSVSIGGGGADDDDDIPTVDPGGEETITLDYCTYGEGGYDQ